MVDTAMAKDVSSDAAVSQAELLCNNMPDDLVKPLPSPFNIWMVLVCTPQSQALVPAEGMVWFTHGTSDAIAILALPPDATPPPKSDGKEKSYGVPFTSFFATETKDEKFKRAVSVLKKVQANSENILPASEVEHVFQLDAVSDTYKMRYNIFFFVRSNLPEAAVVCIDACSKVLYFDILSTSEAKKRSVLLLLRP